MKRSIKTVLGTLLLLTTAGQVVDARPVTNDFGITQQDDPVMQWFMDAKFGMFLH